MKIFLVLVFVLFGVQGIAQEKAQEAYSAGVKLLNEKKFVEAELKFQIAIDQGVVENGIKLSNIYMGFALNGQGKYKEAVSFFSTAIAIDSLDLASFTDRALAYAYQGDNKNAVDDFYHVLTQLGRSHSEALGRRGFYFSVVHYIFSFDLLGIGT